jgi:hypothetical protein
VSAGLREAGEKARRGGVDGCIGGTHRHDGVFELAAEVGLGGLLHLDEDHGRDLLGAEHLLLPHVVHPNEGLAFLRDDFVGEKLLIVLHSFVIVLAADEAFDIENCVLWIKSPLILCSVSN